MSITVDLSIGEFNFLQKQIPKTVYADSPVNSFWQSQVPQSRHIIVNITKPILTSTIKALYEIEYSPPSVEELFNKFEHAGRDNLNKMPQPRIFTKKSTHSKCHRRK